MFWLADVLSAYIHVNVLYNGTHDYIIGLHLHLHIPFAGAGDYNSHSPLLHNPLPLLSSKNKQNNLGTHPPLTNRGSGRLKARTGRSDIRTRASHTRTLQNRPQANSSSRVLGRRRGRGGRRCRDTRATRAAVT